MATQIEIEVITREVVKPSFPTPENCRRYELSSLDQYMPTLGVSLLLFYPPTTRLMSVSQKSQLLIKSLSKTLTSFYHFAGRLRDNIAVDCNDEGAEFVTTKVNCLLWTLLSNPDFGTLEEFIPRQTFRKEELSASSSPLLLVKANFFNCGGLAIGVSLSHKISDASTLSTFLNAWASATLKSEIEPEFIPQFISSTSVFPPRKPFVSSVVPPKVADIANEKVELKRLVFHRAGIEALRSKAASASTVQNPTRVEAVSALIWKCAIEALSESKHSEYSCFLPVNIRKRMNPCLPENTVGNHAILLQANMLRSSEMDKPELKDLIVLLRKSIDEFKAIWKTGFPAEALSGLFAIGRRNNCRHHFLATSWCRFPIYGADFGWGKPVWICSPIKGNAKNLCVMMDTRDGEGIEVDLWLPEEEMKRFKTNPEILAFACLNPAVII